MKLFFFSVAFTLAVVSSCESSSKHKPEVPNQPQQQDTVASLEQKDTKVVEEPKSPPTLPDLVILSASVSPDGILAPGTVCTFKFQVKNIGQGDYPYYIVVGAPGGQTGGFQGLNAGETKEATLTQTYYSRATTYEFSFTVDPDNVIKESDESNNKSQTFRIQTTY